MIVFVPAAPAPMTADCLHLAGPALSGAMTIGVSPASPTSLRLATDSYPGPMRIENVNHRGKASVVLTIRNSLPIAFDPTGTRLLYLVGHSPPRLWKATITAGHLTDRARLPKQPAGWGPVAW